jgi:hypothetical protein
VADAAWYRSSFGELRLWLSRISTDRSRTLVVHEMSSGDDHVIEDRGRGPVRARCTVLFARMAGDDLDPLERCRRLQAVVDDRPRIFSHPTSGSYLARIGPFTEEVDEFGVITAEIEVLQVAPAEAVAPAGAGAIPVTGAGAVSAAADAVTAELADVGMTSSLPGDATAAVDGWTSADTVNTRQVLTELGSLTSQLGDQADALEGDIGLWAAFKATMLLTEAVRAAADAATSDTAQTFSALISAPIALRALLAAIYPADEVDDRYVQAMALNDIAAPAWLEPGTELLLPQLAAAARSG